MSEYKRLTKKDEKGRWVAETGHFCVYHDDKSPSAADMMFGDIVNRLAELENKIESGELVELPKKEVIEVKETKCRLYKVTFPTSRSFGTEEKADGFINQIQELMQEKTSR